MKVNEIFYSLQGEGKYTGTPAIFIRLSGCNLHCWFCDTIHQEGQEMTEEDILNTIQSFPTRHVVITGGEPTLQLNAKLTTLLHQHGYYIQIETNGTTPLAPGTEVDWITCSPKRKGKNGAYHPIQLQRIDELKVIFESPDQDLSPFDHVIAQEYRLQPCDVQNEQQNLLIRNATIQYILNHPKWNLSLQTHKMLNVR